MIIRLTYLPRFYVSSTYLRHPAEDKMWVVEHIFLDRMLTPFLVVMVILAGGAIFTKFDTKYPKHTKPHMF